MRKATRYNAILFGIVAALVINYRFPGLGFTAKADLNRWLGRVPTWQAIQKQDGHYYLSVNDGRYCTFKSDSFRSDYPPVNQGDYPLCSDLNKDNAGAKTQGDKDAATAAKAKKDLYYLFPMPDGSGRLCETQLPYWSNLKTTQVAEGEYPACYPDKDKSGKRKTQHQVQPVPAG